MGFYKWAHTPTFRGFESFYGFYGGGEDYFTHGGSKQYDFREENGERCGDGCSRVAWSAAGSYSTTLFSERAVSLVRLHDATEPLFMWLAYQGVHSPGMVPHSYKDAYNGSIADAHRLTFAGMLSCVDEGIGNVTTALQAKGMLDNTLFVFTTDVSILAFYALCPCFVPSSSHAHAVGIHTPLACLLGCTRARMVALYRIRPVAITSGHATRL